MPIVAGEDRRPVTKAMIFNPALTADRVLQTSEFVRASGPVQQGLRTAGIEKHAPLGVHERGVLPGHALNSEIAFARPEMRAAKLRSAIFPKVRIDGFVTPAVSSSS